MRNFHNKPSIGDKKFLLAFIITLLCSIICGIVLYKPANSNPYLCDFAEEYVFFVFNFNNASLLVTRILSDLIYLYVIFAISYFTKFKYLSLILIFLRGLFFGVYVALLIGVSSFSGTVVAIFVYIPASLISFVFCYLVADFCSVVYKKYALLMPLVLSVINLIIYALLINVLFRIIIMIV